MNGVTLFIDRDIWSHRLDAALRAAGIAFVAHRDRFADDTPDADWIAAAAGHGWVIVTRDRRIRYRANEAAAVLRGRLHLFSLTSGNVSAAETAAIVVKAWPAIQRAVAHSAADDVVDHARRRGVAHQALTRRRERLAGTAAGSKDVSCW